jgi:hypothetical protein
MATNIYKVIYHAEVGGKLNAAFGLRQEHISAGSGDPATLQAVLASNGKDVPSGSVIKFDSIANSGCGSALS